MSAQSRPESETTLAEFQSPAKPEPEPDPADDYDGLQAVAAAAETAPEEADGPDCPHDPVWHESGSCMLCEPAWATGEDAEAYREQNPDIYGRNPL